MRVLVLLKPLGLGQNQSGALQIGSLWPDWGFLLRINSMCKVGMQCPNSDPNPEVSRWMQAVNMPLSLRTGCCWTIKKTECWRINAFKLWCWRRLLRVPWTARRSNQSILKEINPEYSLKGLMLKLKLQYFGHLIQRADSLEKTLTLGKIEGKRRRGVGRRWDGWMASPTQWTWIWANSRR